MTWNELNERTGGWLDDDYYAMQELEEDMNEPIWPCDYLTGIVQALKEQDFGATDGWGRLTDNHAEYLENEMLIKELENVR